MKIYLVGGAVRDYLLGLNFAQSEKDWVVIHSSPKEMLKLGFQPVGKDFPVFLHPKTHEEYALARTERKKSPGYAGFEFHALPDVTLEQDLGRRDLTINAMAMRINPEKRQISSLTEISEIFEIIDPYHGQQDIRQKILRHVSPAFIEDPVRILRVARFMARFAHLGFSIASETLSLMKTMVKNGEVNALVRDRVWAEMKRALSEISPDEFFKTLNQCGALEKLLPEFADKISFFGQSVFSSQKIQKSDLSNINLARYMLNFTRSDIMAFCERYPVPVNYRELALAANITQHYFYQQHLSAEDVLNLFEQSDAFRRPKRFNLLLDIFKNTAQALPLKRLITLKKSFDLIKKISATSLLQAGFSGKALGEKIRQEKIHLLKKILLAQ